MTFSDSWKTLAISTLAILALPACGTERGAAEDFVSDNPLPGYGGGDPAGESGELTGTGAGDSGGDPQDGGDSEDGGGDDGSRDVSEADIIHIEGDRLYALSRYGGLAVIDVSRPDVLPVLGRFRANAMPFEMYVENGLVFVMFSGFGRYEKDEDTGYYEWRTSSRLVALDATDPSNIQVTGEFGLPGTLSDSRRVGDVLYLVTYEDGWCWGCVEGVSSTVITSLDVSDETNVQVVDQLRFDDVNDGWSWGGPRSVSATDERMYVSGRVYGDWETSHATIDVVDISDPSGILSKGASIEVAGQIDSRWQMDEHDGVLRVVSQAGWGGQTPPRIETFSVASATDIAPLGSLDMVLPRPESLQSVRFDGHRGYVITFEQTDPLFTLDLSDPADPRQVGELEIPGWVYHMEPRGDRILGIGFDPGNPEGAINVSLFDVGDFENPALVQRVSFGGDWASFAEDQNRIHKSFAILEDLGLLLVPFSGWSWEDDRDCWGTYHSGIQLVDWHDDTLVLRGVAPSHGQARRALVHRDRLLGVSDLAVETFDISDRDTPQRTADLPLAARVNGMTVLDGLLVRLSSDWWTSRSVLEIADASDPESPEALGRLELDALSLQDADYECWYYGYSDVEIFGRQGFVYLVRQGWAYHADAQTIIDVVDVRDPFAPAHVETLVLPFGRVWGYGPHLTNDEKSVVMVGNALVFLSSTYAWSDQGHDITNGTFEILDLTDPAHPVHTATFERPEGLAHGGLQAFGDTVVSWHMVAANEDASKVRFYLDRVYAADPHDVDVPAPVNVPGAVVAWDEATRRAVVVDYRIEKTDLTGEACWGHPRARQWWWEEDECELARRDIKLVRVDDDGAYLLDTVALEGDDGVVRGAAASTSRLFVHLQRGSWASTYEGAFSMPTAEVTVFADWRGNTLEAAATDEVPGDESWLDDLQALDARLVFRASNGLGTVDATTPEVPHTEVHDLYGYYCYDLEVDGDTAYCAMGEFGIQSVTLGQ